MGISNHDVLCFIMHEKLSPLHKSICKLKALISTMLQIWEEFWSKLVVSTNENDKLFKNI